jgi:hypothetical protein
MSFTISLTLDRIAAVEWEVDAELLGFRQHAGDRRRALGYGLALVAIWCLD